MVNMARLSFKSIVQMIQHSVPKGRPRCCVSKVEDIIALFNDVFAPTDWKSLDAQQKYLEFHQNKDYDCDYVILGLSPSDRPDKDLLSRTLYIDKRSGQVRAKQNKLVREFYLYLYKHFNPTDTILRLKKALRSRNAELITASHPIMQEFICAECIGFDETHNKKIVRFLEEALQKDPYSALMYLLIVSVFPCSYDGFTLSPKYSYTDKICDLISVWQADPQLHHTMPIAQPIPKDDYQSYMHQMMDWLLRIPVRWGAVDSATEIQHANIIEGLLAMKYIGYDTRKEQTYRQILREALACVRDDGLSSKSLKASTANCTSLLLELIAMERRNPSGIIQGFSKYDRIAAYIWENRNPNYGWGMYSAYMHDDDCSLPSTCKMLLTLLDFNIAQTSEFDAFCQHIFECSSDGKMGFFIGDSESRLITTALLICIFFKMPKALQKKIEQSYNLTEGIDFVFQEFVKEDKQIEVETLYGIDRDGVGAKKAPWNHITIRYTVQALSLAYANRKIGELQFSEIIGHVHNILQKNVAKDIHERYTYYFPRGMEAPRNGHWTFPTVYFIIALHLLNGL